MPSRCCSLFNKGNVKRNHGFRIYGLNMDWNYKYTVLKIQSLKVGFLKGLYSKQNDANYVSNLKIPLPKGHFPPVLYIQYFPEGHVRLTPSSSSLSYNIVTFDVITQKFICIACCVYGPRICGSNVNRSSSFQMKFLDFSTSVKLIYPVDHPYSLLSGHPNIEEWRAYVPSGHCVNFISAKLIIRVVYLF